MMKQTFKIAGIGEILWDTFPDGSRLGGAPANFAFHCYQLGAESYPVGCVGDDDLGNETLDELTEKGVKTEYVQVHNEMPTGRVLVSLDKGGKPSYEIVEDVAWDHLTWTPELKALAESLNIVCFGSLSQRSEKTRETLRQFIGAMSNTAIKVCDVNLRKPFFNKVVVKESLEMANILKLSDEELPVLAEYFDLTGSEKELLEKVREKFELTLIAYTKGADGSILLGEYEMSETEGVKVKAVDTVGAGDSFTAALCTGLLKGWRLDRVNEFANKVAAYVCSQKGATPSLPDDFLKAEMES